MADLAIDGCITTAPCGGEVGGRSPVDRGTQGRTRSLAVDAAASRWGRSPRRPTAMTPRSWHQRWRRWW